MKFQWQVLRQPEYAMNSANRSVTHAANVPGGMIVRTVEVFDNEPRASALVFVPLVYVSESGDIVTPAEFRAEAVAAEYRTGTDVKTKT